MNEEDKKVEEQVVQEEIKTEETPEVLEAPQNEEVPQDSNGNKKKGSNLFTIALLVIIVLLIAIIVILLLGGNNKNKNNENKDNTSNNENVENVENTESNNNQENTNNENNEINNNNTNIDDIIEPQFASITCGGADFNFQKETVLAKDIKTSDKLGMLATVLAKMYDTKNLVAGVETELDFDINEVAKKYFDITPEMEKQMEEGFGTGFLWFSRKDQKSFVTFIVGGCIAPENEGNYVKHKESKIEGNTLISTYYYYYRKNTDVIDDGTYTKFPYSYYKSESDPTPVYKDIITDDSVDFSIFNTYDLYFDISDGNTKLIKIVYNAK